ncbi:MAG: ABC transporter substrate binding protein, partial [Pseudolabrys sp.]
MIRREVIKVIGSGLVAWPLAAARAQQSERVRRVGVLQSQAAGDAERQAYLAAFRQELERLGWADGRNIQIDYRWGAGNAADTRKYATELVALKPDVIFTIGSASMPPLLQATSSVPIVFALVADPVGAGFVNSLARPGGNATGFISVEYTFGGKWL